MLNNSSISFQLIKARLFFSAILVLILIACQAASSDPSSTENTITIGNYALGVNDIILSPADNFTIQIDQKKTITADISPSNAAFQRITWENNNTGMIRLSSSVGKSIVVTPVSNGTAVVTASAGGKSKSIKVIVKADKVTGISLDAGRLTLLTNTTVDLTALITPFTATNQRVFWSNANTNAVKMAVSNNAAAVTGMSPGDSVITAVAEDGGWQASVAVSVRDFWVTNITLNKTNLTLEYRNEGDTATLTAAVLPADAPIKNIHWESSDTSIATVADGVIYPVRSGTVTITASSAENPALNVKVKATAAVTVKADWLLRLSLSATSIRLEQTSNAVVRASFYPVTALDTNVTWLSLDRQVATVSDQGDGSAIITGLSRGAAVIIARVGDKSALVTVGIIPDLPRNFRQNLTCSKTDTAELVWDASPGADSYEISRVDNGVTNRITTTTSAAYALTGLSANTYYTYEVKACAGGQCSAPSSLKIVTGSSGNNLSTIITSGKIPADLNNYGKSYQDVFGGYAANASIVFRYVAPNGSGKIDGSSWANAAANLKTVLDGITDAAADKVYAIMIKPGTYQAGAQMEMKNYVTIAGGVSGCNTIPSNPGGEGTTLSGENSYQVFSNNYTAQNPLTSTSRLYGVTIADGNTTGNGGGMYNYYSSPVLTGVVFSGNTANWSGGGMNNWASSPILSEVTFSGNTADNGGGMYNYYSSPVLTGVVFSGNTADNGGGMYNTALSAVVLNGVVFSGNTANQLGGGMYYDNDGLNNHIIVNSILWGNRVGNTANQIFIANDGGADDEYLSLYNSIVEGGMPAGYVSGTIVINLNGGGFSSWDNANITVNFSDIISNDPKLSSLADNGGGIGTMAIPTTSPAVNKGLYVKRSGGTFYYSIDKTDWYTSPALSGTAVTPPNDAIDLTATDMTGYPVNGRPDIGVYEAR